VPGFVCRLGCAHRRFAPPVFFYQLDATQT
jgi:hypothetical protein